jgi:hypothetical protein
MLAGPRADVDRVARVEDLGLGRADDVAGRRRERLRAATVRVVDAGAHDAELRLDTAAAQALGVEVGDQSGTEEADSQLVVHPADLRTESRARPVPTFTVALGCRRASRRGRRSPRPRRHRE